jgi:hypothetical protein
MSYTVDLIVGNLPLENKQAWKAIEELREVYYDDKREKSDSLIALHADLTARYPCLCSYDDDNDRADECPWADGPMLGNFAHDMGMLAILFSRADEVVPFIIDKANALGITVADGQSERIFRPGNSASVSEKPKPWWRPW